MGDDTAEMRGREGGEEEGKAGVHETVNGADKRDQRGRQGEIDDGWAGGRKMGNIHGAGRTWHM